MKPRRWHTDDDTQTMIYRQWHTENDLYTQNTQTHKHTNPQNKHKNTKYKTCEKTHINYTKYTHKKHTKHTPNTQKILMHAQMTQTKHK